MLKKRIIKLQKIDGEDFLNKNPFKIFGSDIHKYKLNTCLSEQEIINFEQKNHIQLPFDYRNFLNNIGNGGVGPAYGLYKLKDWNLGYEIELNDFLKTDFPHNEKWNIAFSEEDENYTKTAEFQNWEIEYYSEKHIAGSIKVCHYGCAIYCHLVVSGPEKGNIWFDDRASNHGIYPLSSESKERYSFSEWYNEWLSESMKKLKDL
jgi:hypothetical protein